MAKIQIKKEKLKDNPAKTVVFATS